MSEPNRGADINSNHFQVVAKPRLRQSEVDEILYRHPLRSNLHEVAIQYARKLKAALLDEGKLAEANLSRVSQVPAGHD